MLKAQNQYQLGKYGVILFDKRGNQTVIDRQDLERVAPFYWSLNGKNGYFCHRVTKKEFPLFKCWSVSLHRFICGVASYKDFPFVVDHIDGLRFNNKRDNLRLATIKDNNLNRPAYREALAKELAVLHSKAVIKELKEQGLV